MSRTISIWGRYRRRAPERIDTAPDQREAERLLGEYRLAFGTLPGQVHHGEWKLWIGRRADEPEGRFP